MNQNKELAQFLIRNFNLKNLGDLPEENTAFFEFLREQLSQRVEYFINHDMDSLLQALYRIDVSNALVDEAFSLGEIKKVSNAIAVAIIERQLKKLSYRNEYKKD
jgi:hypothetical protein